ncbi:unnamed protein product [Allacma fusca]|uniref:Uncharacterized protein n=1 Tax=Allacma fusca TaxID=39272 RepID=A0A8J2P418_9HEXA|nr:unnamed protein product [Allacma fusca]
MIVIYNVVIVLCKNARRKFPVNIYLLLAGNLSEGILFGIVSSYFGTFSILLGAGIALLVCFIIVAFRLQTRFDFDGLGTSLFQGLAVLVLFALAGTFLNGIFPIVHVCFACLGTLLYLCRFVDAIQSIVSCTHKIPVSPDDYVLASLVIFSAAGF